MSKIEFNPRVQAVLVLQQVLIHRHSLAEQKTLIRNQKDSGFVQALCFGVLRFYWQLNAIAKQLVTKPPKDQELYLLILVGLFDLIYMHTPSYAAVSEAVSAVVVLKKARAKGLVNAVLRNFERNRESLLAEAQKHEESLYNHPAWLVKAIKISWPEIWQNILLANNTQAPMSLRINQQKTNPIDYLQQLQKNNINAKQSPFAKEGIILEKAQDVYELPGFDDGWFFVQDIAAQLAAGLMDLAPGQNVLDACAAPGGKATHLLEVQPKIKLTAVDCEPERVQQVQVNLARLQLTAEVVCADVQAVETWWNNSKFDRILLDAPCSSTGVIRRHPDIKHLRRAADIEQLAKMQLSILQKLWPLLKKDGLLLYATCSVLPQENREVISHFIQIEPSAKVLPIKAEWGVTCQYGRQILPGEHDMDGFYYCLLQK